MHSIFLHYAEQDSEYVEALLLLLSEQGFNHALDWQGMGKRKDALKKMIEETNLSVFFLSLDSLSSSQTLLSLGAAWGINKPILVVVREPSLLYKLPVKISKNRYILINEPIKIESVRQLADSIKELAKQVVAA